MSKRKVFLLGLFIFEVCFVFVMYAPVMSVTYTVEYVLVRASDSAVLSTRSSVSVCYVTPYHYYFEGGGLADGCVIVFTASLNAPGGRI